MLSGIFFERVPPSGAKSKCNTCKKGGTTSLLKNHIQSAHPKQYEDEETNAEVPKNSNFVHHLKKYGGKVWNKINFLRHC